MNMSAHATAKRDTLKPHFLCFRVERDDRLQIAEINYYLPGKATFNYDYC